MRLKEGDIVASVARLQASELQEPNVSLPPEQEKQAT